MRKTLEERLDENCIISIARLSQLIWSIETTIETTYSQHNVATRTYRIIQPHGIGELISGSFDLTIARHLIDMPYLTFALSGI